MPKLASQRFLFLFLTGCLLLPATVAAQKKGAETPEEVAQAVAVAKEHYTFAPRAEWPQKRCLSPALSPQLDTLACVNEKKELLIRDLRTGELRHTVKLDVQQADFAWLTYLDQGATLLVSFTNGELQFFDVAKGQRTKKLDVIGDNEALRWQRTFDKGQQLLTISGSYEDKATFAIHNLKSGAQGKTFQRVTQRFGGKYALSSDGKRVALTQEDKTIAVVEIANPGKPQILEAKEHDTAAMVFAPGDKQLVTVKEGREGLFRVWNLADGKMAQEQPVALGSVRDLSYTLADKVLVASGSQQCLFDAATFKTRGSYPGYERPEAIVLSSDGTLAISLHQEHNKLVFVRLNDVAKPPRSALERRKLAGDAILSASGKYMAVPEERNWVVLDTANWQEQFKITERYTPPAFAPDGDVIAWVKDDSILFRDLENKKDLTPIVKGDFYVGTLQFTDDGKHICGQTNDGLLMWDRATGKLAYGLRGAESKGSGPLAISPDGKWLAFCGESCVVEIWDMAARARAQRFVAHDYSVNQLAFSRDSRALATGGDSVVRLWSAATGKLVHELNLMNTSCKQLWFPAEGTHLVTIDDGGLVCQWDWRKAQLVNVIPTAIPHIERAGLAPGGAALITRHKLEGDEIGYLQLWKTNELLKPAAYQQSPVVKLKVKSYITPPTRMLPILAKIPAGNSYELMELPDLAASAWSPTQPQFILGRRDGSLTLYDAETRSEFRQLPRAPGGLRSLTFTPDGQELLTASGSTLQRIKIQDGKVIWSVKNDRPFRTAIFAPGGKQIITSAYDDKIGQVKVWDAANGQVLQKKEKDPYSVPQVDGATEGGLLLVGNYSPGWMKLTDMNATSPNVSVVTLKAPPKGEQLAALASTEDEKRVLLIDPVRNATVAEIPTEFASASNLVFAPDGKRLYLISGNSGLSCIELATKRELYHISGGPGMSNGGVSADGRYFLGHSESDQAYLYDLQPLTDAASAQLLSQFGSYNPEESRYLPPVAGTAIQPLHLTRRVYGRDNYLSLAQLSQLPNLVSLDLDGAPLDDQVAAHLGKCRELRKLRFVNSNYLTATGVASLAQMPNLEELELGAESLTNDAIAPLAKLPKLRRLVLRSPKLTAAAAAELAKFPALAEIGWQGASFDAELSTALAKVPQLTAIELLEVNAEPDALAPLAAATKLRRLKFFQNEIDGADLLAIKQLTTLECVNVRLTSVDQLAQLPQLAELTVRESQVDFNQFAALQQAKQLKKFEFSFGYGENFNGLEKLAGLPGPKVLELSSNMKPKQVAGIAGWTSIEELKLTGSDTDETLQHLAGLKNLRVLKFNEYNSSPLTGTGLAHLAACTNLTELNLKGQKLTSEGIGGLAGLTQLTSLTLPQVDDQSIVHLAKLTKLTRLKLLGGGEKKLTDAAADTLLKLPELTHLDLGQTEFKAVGVEKLAALKKLEELRLPFSLPYSDREKLVQQLSQILPNTYVH